ncbi:MAG: hypothetical protein RR162_08850 [Oscillospiraceae bacterium]
MSTEAYTPLEEDVSSLTHFSQVAFWLYRCRHFVERENYLPTDDGQIAYEIAVERFCELWDKHYEQEQATSAAKTQAAKASHSHTQYPSFYETDMFRKALLAQQRLEQVQLIVDTATGPLTINNMLLLDSTTPNSKAILSFFETKNYTFAEYQKTVNAVLNSKSRVKPGLREILKYNQEHEIKSKVVFKRDGKVCLFNTPQEAINFYTKNRPYVRMENGGKKASYDRELVNYKTLLKQFDIQASTFDEYTLDNRGDADYNKRFAYNLGFAFSFDISAVEKLLNYMGYTMYDSLRHFDNVLLSAFQKGLPREYVQAQLARYNQKTQQLTKAGTVKKGIAVLSLAPRPPKK